MATDSVRRLIELVGCWFDSTERKELAERALVEVEALEARVRRLEKALTPFARFAERFDSTPMRGVDDKIHTIHGGIPEKEASLRLSECRAARKALLGEDE